MKQVSNSESACSFMQQCATITQVGTSYLASLFFGRTNHWVRPLLLFCLSSILAEFLILHLRCVAFLAIGFYHPVLMSNQDEWHDPVQFGGLLGSLR